MDQNNLFTTKDGAIYANTTLSIKVENTNIKQTPDGNLDVFLFGALLIAFDETTTITKTMTLGTRVIVPIYSNEQIEEDHDHTMIHFYPGDKVVLHNLVPKTVDNVQEMFNTLANGHLSRYIPYHLYYDIILNTMETNEHLGFPRILLEMMLGEMFINEKGQKLRRTGEEHGVPASIADIVQTAGAFNSMLFEDANKSILINKGKTREEQLKPSKLEEYFRK